LPYYGNLAKIFGNTVATGQFAKSSNEPLATEVDDTAENDGTTNLPSQSAVNDDNGAASSSATRPSKKAKIVEGGNEGLGAILERSTETLANAIKEAAVANATAMKEAAIASRSLPNGLLQIVDSIPGFEHQHKSIYYAHLVANPDIARAFVDMPLLYQVSWVSKFVSDNF